MDTLLDFTIDILAKRLPTERVTVKIDHIHHKIRLVPLPDDIIEENFSEPIKVPNEDGSTPR